MDTQRSKAQVLAELQAEYAGWEALLSEIGEARMPEPGVAGEWSIKDIMAHLTGWRRRAVGRLQAALQQQPSPAPPWPPHLETDEEINAWIYEANRDRSVSEVLQDSRAVFEQLLETLSAFPKVAFQDPARFGWPAGEPLSGATFFAHFHEEHEPDMRTWLAKHRQ